MHAHALALITILATASASPYYPVHENAARYPVCEPVECPFHFNDTSLGHTKSCTPDVTGRGKSPPSKIPPETCVDGPSTNYTVASGDTLEMIAAEFSSGVCNIAAANGITNPDFILLGQVLVVPNDVCTPDNDSCRATEGTATCVVGGAPTYVIQSGDTFFLVAASLGLTLDSVVAANAGVDASTLQIGQVINIPVCPTTTAATSAPTSAPTSYHVRS